MNFPKGQKLIINLNDLRWEFEVFFQILDNGLFAWGVKVGDDINWITGDEATMALHFPIIHSLAKAPPVIEPVV